MRQKKLHLSPVSYTHLDVYKRQPGVPILVPGEKILKETVENISQYLYNGYNVLGLSKEDQVQVLLKGDFIR